jgi:hypothetical protein
LNLKNQRIGEWGSVPEQAAEVPVRVPAGRENIRFPPPQIVRRIGHTRRYEPLPSGLRAMTALLVLRNKAIKPLLAAAQPLCPTRGPHNPKPIDRHYHTINVAIKGVFHELGLAA